MLAVGLFVAAALQVVGDPPGETPAPRAAILVTLILFLSIASHELRTPLSTLALSTAELPSNVVTSELGEGSTFVVEWPRIAA